MFYINREFITYNDLGFIHFWNINNYSYIKKYKILTGILNENCDYDIENSIIFSIGGSGMVQSTNYNSFEDSKLFQ